MTVFKYFQIDGYREIFLKVKGNARGEFRISNSEKFTEYVCVPVEVEKGECKIVSGKLMECYGKTALYIKYLGEGVIDFYEFELREI